MAEGAEQIARGKIPAKWNSYLMSLQIYYEGDDTMEDYCWKKKEEVQKNTI